MALAGGLARGGGGGRHVGDAACAGVPARLVRRDHRRQPGDADRPHGDPDRKDGRPAPVSRRRAGDDDRADHVERCRHGQHRPAAGGDRRRVADRPARDRPVDEHQPGGRGCVPATDSRRHGRGRLARRAGRAGPGRSRGGDGAAGGPAGDGDLDGRAEHVPVMGRPERPGLVRPRPQRGPRGARHPRRRGRGDGDVAHGVGRLRGGAAAVGHGRRPAGAAAPPGGGAPWGPPAGRRARRRPRPPTCGGCGSRVRWPIGSYAGGGGRSGGPRPS